MMMFSFLVFNFYFSQRPQRPQKAQSKKSFFIKKFFAYSAPLRETFNFSQRPQRAQRKKSFFYKNQHPK